MKCLHCGQRVPEFCTLLCPALGFAAKCERSEEFAPMYAETPHPKGNGRDEPPDSDSVLGLERPGYSADWLGDPCFRDDGSDCDCGPCHRARCDAAAEEAL